MVYLRSHHDTPTRQILKTSSHPAAHFSSMLRFVSVFIIVLFSNFLLANMASPIQEGHTGALPFLARHVSIDSEHILIQPSPDFKTAIFKIKYQVRVDSSGVRIPLVFQAMDYMDGFQLMVDGIPQSTKSLPYEYIHSDSFPNNDFSDFIGAESLVTVYYDKDYSIEEELEDLIYLEVDLAEGTHTIEISYTAESWIDESDLILKRYFYYSLAPARYWKSFGTLSLEIQAESSQPQIHTNLGEPKTGSLPGFASWTFNSIPVDVVEISWKPEPSEKAKFYMDLGPDTLVWIFGFILASLHFLFIKIRRRKNQARINWVVVIGGLLIPFLVLNSYMYAVDIIDNIIGEYASRRHGYLFLVNIYYPVLMPVYMLVCFLWDWFWKRRFHPSA
ncbi:MAG: hypothetical protein R2784_04765 [Saprospiraceae bacterium]